METTHVEFNWLWSGVISFFAVYGFLKFGELVWWRLTRDKMPIELQKHFDQAKRCAESERKADK